MAVDALLPIGSELIMVLAGALAAGAIAGTPSLFGHPLGGGAQTYVVLALAGTAGSLIGALAGWRIGRTVGRGFVERHGHRFHLGYSNMTKAERWFERHGALAVLLGRLTPLVRSFISIPAGVFAEPLPRYTALTAVGSAIWCFGFAALGWGFGAGYKSIDHATHFIEGAVLLAVAGAATWLWTRHGREADSGTGRD